jgi:radical SAM/Cys-rich protein
LLLMSSVLKLTDLEPAAPQRRHDFADALRRRGLDLSPLKVETLQVNLTKLCNQACRHCHVDASPARTERLSGEGVEKLFEILARYPQIRNLDLTGGAPELHPQFDELVERAVAYGRHVMVRHNLTVQLDGNPQTGEDKAYLPGFFARQRVEVISSLPYYDSFFTDSQRGKGVFGKSIEALKRLNAVGYGRDGTGLALNLVYNPVGPYLPPPQATLQADYKRELRDKFGVAFNELFTITNMPINRFRLHLKKSGQYEGYLDKLDKAFNASAAEGVMCRSLISVGHDGVLYDCDFNQQLEVAITTRDGDPATLFNFDLDELLQRRIRFESHCFGCTAGAGSSCGGAISA